MCFLFILDFRTKSNNMKRKRSEYNNKASTEFKLSPISVKGRCSVYAKCPVSEKSYKYIDCSVILINFSLRPRHFSPLKSFSPFSSSISIFPRILGGIFVVFLYRRWLPEIVHSRRLTKFCT